MIDGSVHLCYAEAARARATNHVAAIWQL